MLTPAQILPFLQHPDEPVRNLAAGYLEWTNDPSIATAEDIWRLIDRFGGGKYHRNYFPLARLPHTHASLVRTLAARSATSNPNLIARLEGALQNISHGLLVRFADLIEGNAAISTELRDHLRQRIELAHQPANDLWDRLMEHGQKVPQEKDHWSPENRRFGARLIEALSRNPESAHWAISLLNDPAINDWREICAVELLGEMRFQPAIELLFDKLARDEDDDGMLESAGDALAQIGGAHVVQSVLDRFEKLPWGIRLHSTEILKRIKTTKSEAAAAHLLTRETDLGIRTSLAESLCELATTLPDTLDRLGQMARSDDWEQTFLDLHSDVSALYTMVGRTPPTRNKPKPAPPFIPTPFINDLSRDEELAAIEDPDMDLMGDLAPDLEPLVPRPTTIRRATAKIGRNDPCPCGSGKKYKKCCGK